MLLTGLLSTWETAIYKAVNPDWQWHILENRLGGIRTDAAMLQWWAKTKDGQKNRNRPKSVMPQNQASKGRMAGAQSMTVDELKEYLARPRTEVIPTP